MGSLFSHFSLQFGTWSNNCVFWQWKSSPIDRSIDPPTNRISFELCVLVSFLHKILILVSCFFSLSRFYAIHFDAVACDCMVVWWTPLICTCVHNLVFFFCNLPFDFSLEYLLYIAFDGCKSTAHRLRQREGIRNEHHIECVFPLWQRLCQNLYILLFCFRFCICSNLFYSTNTHAHNKRNC